MTERKIPKYRIRRELPHTDPESEELRRLEKPANRQTLNALLNIYEAFGGLVMMYLEDITKPPGDLDIIYIRKLVRLVQSLAEELRLDPSSKSVFKLPTHYIPFRSLSKAGRTLRNTGKTSEMVREDILDVYGDLKLLANRVGAVGQKPLPAVQEAITETHKLLSLIRDGGVASSAGITPKIFSEKGWWCISMSDKKQKPIQLLKQGFWAGDLFGILGNPWGTPRSRESVLNTLEETTGKKPDGTQIHNAMREINRTLKKRKMPQLVLVGGANNTLLFALKETHE